MIHGLSNQFLYSAYKIKATFADEIGRVRCGQGTCFFVKDRTKLVLITNRHVLDLGYKSGQEFSAYTLREIEVSGKIGQPPHNTPIGDVVFSLQPNVRFHPHDDNDIACVAPLLPVGAGARIDYFIPWSMFATAAEYMSDLSVCDFVAFPGYPPWHDDEANRPIFRSGTISSDPRFNYRCRDSVRGDCVAYEAFSYGGSSGSPVFALQKGIRPGLGIQFPDFREARFIGINAGHLRNERDGQGHSGISYFFKSTAIAELIEI